MTAYYGETATKIKAIFDEAMDVPTVIFIDEVDAFGMARKGDKDSQFMRQILTQLLQSIQDFTNAVDCRSFLIAATNTPSDLDSAIRRRFKSLIYCGLPTAHERYLLLNKLIPNEQRDDTLNENCLREFANKMDLYSSSDITSFCNYVRESPIIQIQRATYFKLNPQNKWIPCANSTESGAEAKTLQSLDEDSLGPRRACSRSDMDAVFESNRPTLSQEKHDKFLDELSKIGGSDVCRRMETTDLKSTVFEETSAEQQEIDFVLFSGSTLPTAVKNVSFFTDVARVQRFYLRSSSGELGICYKTVKKVKIGVFACLVVCAFVPWLLWFLVFIVCSLVLLNTVVLPFVGWWESLSGDEANVEFIIQETAEKFLVFFVFANMSSFMKFIVVTNISVVDAMVITWIFYSLENLLGAMVGYYVFQRGRNVQDRLETVKATRIADITSDDEAHRDFSSG
jgi:hypothetical protein